MLEINQVCLLPALNLHMNMCSNKNMCSVLIIRFIAKCGQIKAAAQRLLLRSCGGTLCMLTIYATVNLGIILVINLVIIHK